MEAQLARPRSGPKSGSGVPRANDLDTVDLFKDKDNVVDRRDSHNLAHALGVLRWSLFSKVRAALAEEVDSRTTTYT